MNELLPCPFCGSTDVHLGFAAYEYVSCSNCGAHGPDIMPDVTWPGSPGYDDSLRKAQEEAVALWNKRPSRQIGELTVHIGVRTSFDDNANPD